MKMIRPQGKACGALLALAFGFPLLAQQAGPLPATPEDAAEAQTGAPAQTPQHPAGGAASPATASATTPAGSPAATPATATAAIPAAKPAVQPAADAKAPARIEVPTGTHIPLVLHNGISTRSARPGDPVYFETLFPVMVDGRVAIPAGTYISGEVTESKRPGRVKGRAELMVKLTTMILPNAYMVNLNATPGGAAGTGGGDTMDKEGKVTGDSDKASDAGTIAKTTAAGAGIGAIASRSAEGAGIGAGIGAAVGLGAVLLSRGPEAELPRGSTLDAVINRPILLDADKVQFTSPGQASTLPGPPNREPTRSRMPF
jgi:type IV secretion system protein VirB10